MCYYLGIEDLAANALIVALQKHSDVLFFSYKQLEEYGAQVVDYLKKKGKEAMLVLSRDLTDAFFQAYDRFFFEKKADNGEGGVALCDEVDRGMLIRIFQGCLPLELLLAFISPESTKVLGLA